MNDHASGLPIDEAAATAALLSEGVVALDGIVDPALLVRCRDAITPHGDFERLGAGAKWTNKDRFFAPVPICGPVADPSVFANPAVLAVAERVLGPDFQIDSFGVIVSRPGAAQQHMHSDGALFPASQIDRMLPPVALTFALPLVPMDEVSGTTGFVLKSHRALATDAEVDYAPNVPVGSGLLWDYRVRHRGLANRGSRPRPVLFAVYCRAWWHDAQNFDEGRVAKLVLPAATRDRLDIRERRLLVRALHQLDAPLASQAGRLPTGLSHHA